MKEFGEKGFVVLNGGARTSLNVYGILPLLPTVITAVQFQSEYNGDVAIVGLPLPAGVFIPLRSTELDIASGTCLAYLE